jgi:hypothetical protein
MLPVKINTYLFWNFRLFEGGERTPEHPAEALEHEFAPIHQSSFRNPSRRESRGDQMKSTTWIIGAGLASATIAAVATGAFAQSPTTVTIATVNNSDMKTMESLTGEFEKVYLDIKLKWNVLPENELRQKVTTDIATGARVCG